MSKKKPKQVPYPGEPPQPRAYANPASTIPYGLTTPGADYDPTGFLASSYNAPVRSQSQMLAALLTPPGQPPTTVPTPASPTPTPASPTPTLATPALPVPTPTPWTSQKPGVNLPVNSGGLFGGVFREALRQRSPQSQKPWGSQR